MEGLEMPAGTMPAALMVVAAIGTYLLKPILSALMQWSRDRAEIDERGAQARAEREEKKESSEQAELGRLRDRVEKIRSDEATKFEEMYARVLVLEEQIAAMHVEVPIPEWSLNTQTGRLIRVNRQAQLQLFSPEGVFDPVGKTMAEAGISEPALDALREIDARAMSNGTAAIGTVVFREGMPRHVVIKVVGHGSDLVQVTRGMALRADSAIGELVGKQFEGPALPSED